MRHNHEEKEDIWKANSGKLKSQINLLLRETKDKENSVSELKENNKRTSHKLQNSEGKVEELLVQLRKLQELYETKMDNVTLENTYEL